MDIDIDHNITFTNLKDPMIINKDHFYTEQNTNYIYINQDNQGNYWSRNRRENLFASFLKKSNGYRNVTPITQREKDERNAFHLFTLKDLFYQFNKYYRKLPLYLTHFQIRKNLKKINNELFYTKKYGIESIDLVTHKQQTLISYNEEEADMALCFDLIKESNGDYLLCIGNNNSVCELLKIANEDYMKVKQNKVTNISPPSQLVFSLNESADHSFINYVTFIPNNRLISVSNDQCLRMYDLIKGNKVIMKIKNESPINHCDMNEDAGIIVCVGDSCSVDILDMKANRFASRINEHYDYSVVVKFNPYNSNLFATGNQDFSSRIWDLRKLDKSSYQLHGFTDSIGDLAWTSRSSIVYGENSLFAHVYDLNSKTIQSLSYFGSLSGVIYDDKRDKIYCGVYDNDQSGSGIMEYSRINHSYSNKRNYEI